MEILAAVYMIMACDQSVAMIVEREVSGRYVSLAHVTGVPIDDSKKQWLYDGLVEAVESHEVYEITSEIECGTPV